VDAEQIRGEMTETRVAMDRKLDKLAIKTEEITDNILQRTIPIAMFAGLATLGVWWWRRRGIG
jgi:hypothetical protein